MLNRHRLSAPAKSAPATSLPQNSRFGLVLSTVKYLLRTEVHTFAFSVAANAILLFFPFVLLLTTIIRRVFHSTVMYETVLQLLRDFLPARQEFVIRNLNALVGAPSRLFALSVSLMFWAFLSGLLLLTGAHLSAQRHVRE
jgi:uncharacterized BrkB/YihY/UPF0761 family membrane protein